MRLKLAIFAAILATAASTTHAQSSHNSPSPFGTFHSHAIIGNTVTRKMQKRALELGDPYDTNDCNRLHDEAERLTSPGYYQQAYDTARAYLFLCHDQPMSSGMFGWATGDNQFRDDDSLRYVEYREWLKSVLYLRHDDRWYCDDVDAIVSSMDYFEGRGYDHNGTIAILEYVLARGGCDTSYFAGRLAGAIAARHEGWLDSTYHERKDTLLYPMDTTIPTLEQLKLGILRGDPAGIAPNTEFTGEKRIENIHVSENPFMRSSSVEFELNDYGLVTFELFDALGRLQFTNGIGQVLSPGRHSFDIDGSKLASGVYFARLSYHGGEVKSVMVRKE